MALFWVYHTFYASVKYLFCKNLAFSSPLRESNHRCTNLTCSPSHLMSIKGNVLWLKGKSHEDSRLKQAIWTKLTPASSLTTTLLSPHRWFIQQDLCAGENENTTFTVKQPEMSLGYLNKQEMRCSICPLKMVSEASPYWVGASKFQWHL